MLDLGVFFAVLLVGFAYVWSRGDLDWVRAIHHPATPAETAAQNTPLSLRERG
jgi:NADH-quinone oxidoreductase subunit A